MKRDFGSIQDKTYDVIVVGGGIVGAGIARDATLRGLDTLLLEKEDFGSGTTSRSTRLAHGGLRYLRQLERAGYIAVEVIHARTRMCAGLCVALLDPLFPRHQRQKWPAKLIEPDAPQMSQNNRLKIKYSRESWALRCMDGVFRSFLKTIPPLPALD